MFEKTMVRGLLAALALASMVDGNAWGQIQAGDLYEADSYSNTVYQFTPSGTKSTFASGFEPTGLAFDSQGDLFVSDYGTGNIYEFNATSGSRSTFASGLIKPQGLAFYGGNLYAVESDFGGAGSVYEYSGGSRSTVVTGLNDPCGLAFDSSNNLYVANYFSGTIEKITNGVPSTFASGLSYPNCLAFDSSGNLFETDAGSGNIYEFDATSGSRSTFAGGFDGGYDSGPDGLAIDSHGNLFVGDLGTGNIIELSSSGQTTFANGLDYPEFLAFAPTPAPEPSTIALLIAGTVGLLALAWRKRHLPR